MRTSRSTRPKDMRPRVSPAIIPAKQTSPMITSKYNQNFVSQHVTSDAISVARSLETQRLPNLSFSVRFLLHSDENQIGPLGLVGVVYRLIGLKHGCCGSREIRLACTVISRWYGYLWYLITAWPPRWVTANLRYGPIDATRAFWWITAVLCSAGCGPSDLSCTAKRQKKPNPIKIKI